MIEGPVLILAAHPDDIELAMGGTLAKMIEDDIEIDCLIFCEKGYGDKTDLLRNEIKESFKINSGATLNYDTGYENQHLEEDRDTLLDYLIHLRNNFFYKTIFTHCSTDIHQDHSTLHRESVRAFKHSNLYGYEMTWNNLTSNQRFFVEINQSNLDKKLEAMACYKSQQDRIYFNPELMKGLATVRGSQANVKYAESFEVIRQIW